VASWLVMKFYDIPVRKYLAEKRNKRFARQKLRGLWTYDSINILSEDGVRNRPVGHIL